MRKPPELDAGQLGVLGRQALMPRLERIQQALRIRGAQDEAQLRWTTTVSADVREAAQTGRAGAPASPNQPAVEESPLPGYTLRTSSTDYYPSLTQQQQQELPYPDRTALRNVQVELRALRTEIQELSRKLGFTSTATRDYRGLLQQFDELDSDVRLMRFREDDDLRSGRERVQLMREQERDSEIERVIKRNIAARISRRQRELLRALQRVERQLEQRQVELPVGMRDRLIGEIYDAKYSTAAFGGVLGAVTSSGMAFSVAA